MITLSQLRPGDSLPTRRHHVDQALIDAYAIVSGDHNPLHTDPAFAATTQFGRTIAHGMMTLAFVSAAMEAWAGSAWVERGVIDVTFLSPVHPGDEVSVTAEVEEPGAGMDVACRVTCTVAERKVMVGQVAIPSDPGRAPA